MIGNLFYRVVDFFFSLSGMRSADDGGGGDGDTNRRLYKTRYGADNLKLNVTFTSSLRYMLGAASG